MILVESNDLVMTVESKVLSTQLPTAMGCCTY